MSYNALKECRDALISDSTLTSLVPASNINVGWLKTDASFPCITITQAAGTDIGQLGRNSASSGSKLDREIILLQLNIYSRDSISNVYKIRDAIKKVMMSQSYTQTVDRDGWEEPIKSYSKTTVWQKIILNAD